MLRLICVEIQVAVVVLLRVLAVDISKLSAVECLVMFLMHGLFNDEVDWLPVMIIVMVMTGVFSSLSNLKSMVALGLVT